ALTEALAEWLASRRLLLVLDNCEHLAEACAELADYLHHSASRLRILVTSRQPLECPGEVAWRVPSLALPETGGRLGPDELGRFEAVRLFVDRAVVARSTFRLTHENSPAVAEICRRLDGIPLALELAASL